MSKLKNIIIVIVVMLTLLPITYVAADNKTSDLVPNATGFPGQQVEYTLLLSNSDSVVHTYSLEAKNLPKKYVYKFYHNEYVLADKLEIKPGGTAEIKLQVIIPDNIKEESFIKLSAMAIRDDNLVTELPLSLHASNSYILKMTNSSFNLQVLSGKQIEFPLNITNSGQKELTNITVELELPYKWQAIVMPQKIDKLEAGKSYSFKVKVLVPDTQDAGNQKIKVSAESDQAAAEAFTIPVLVQKSSRYLIVPIAAIIIVFVSVGLYFKRRGRR